MASPRTYLLAPSMAPKNSDSDAKSDRRFRASFSSIAPTFNSASIAICLPGNESSVKRALTSEIRVAPLVITMNWIVTKIRNTTQPTIRLPPTTKSPNASTIFPALPSRRIKRVVATLSASRYSVINSSKDGKTETSNGRFAFKVVNSNKIAIAKLAAKNVSSRNAGSGTINTTNVMRNAADSHVSLC